MLLLGCPQSDGGGEETAEPALGTSGAVALETYMKEALREEIPTAPLAENEYPPSTFDLGTTVAFSTSTTSRAGTGTDSAEVPTSETNVQVEGVDESDVVKVGGGHAYIALPQHTHLGWDPRLLPRPVLGAPVPMLTTGVITPGTTIQPAPGLVGTVVVLDEFPEREIPDFEPARIRVLSLDATPPEANEVAVIELSEEGTSIDGLYFLPASATDPRDLLVVLATGSPYGAIVPDYGRASHWANGRTSVHWIDVSDPASPSEVDRVSIEGRLADSRRIDDLLYVVTRHAPTLEIHPLPRTDAEAADNRRAIDAARLDDLLPDIEHRGRPSDRLVHPRDCTVLRASVVARKTTALSTITQLDLRNPGRQRSSCLAGSVDTLYATPRSLYLTSQTSWASTDFALHKFALSERGAAYRGTGRVPGQLHGRGVGSSFHLGEHEDVVGVVTSLNRSHPDFAGQPDAVYEHRLTLLREAPGTEPALEEIARLPNRREPAPIGKPDEFLYGVRFMGDRVYVVTFRKVDPLYILDIADPENPRIAGEVEVPGFSNYLHPVGRDLLLGFGQDTAEGVRNNWFQGVKLELFDVSDPSTLRTIDAEVIGRRGSQSPALREHRAFTFLADANGDIDRIAVPIVRHDRLREGGDPDSPTESYLWSDSGLYLFELVHDPAGAFLEPAGALIVDAHDPGDETWASHWLGEDDRGVIQGDAVHFVHDHEISSAPWSDPTDVTGPR